MPDPILDAPHRLRLDAIRRAGAAIDPLFRNSPQYECEPLSAALGVPLSLKVETANPLRSFKGRGADFYARESAAALARRTLVCATAGNWGQALAFVCRARGWPLVVYAATTANALKVERMRAMGADVRLVGDDFDAAKREALAWSERERAVFVEDGREASIAEGAGTIGVELLAGGTVFDTLLVPLGNGALATGIGRWIKAHAPSVRVVGVCAQGADAMAASFNERRCVVRERVATIADGIAVREPVPDAVTDMQGTVDDVWLVPDDALLLAMRLVHEHAGLVVEPAGAAGVAAAIEHAAACRGMRLATVLAGGNVTPEQAALWLK